MWAESDSANAKIEEVIANFRKWLEEELRHPELKKCYDDAKREKLKEIKSTLESTR